MKKSLLPLLALVPLALWGFSCRSEDNNSGLHKVIGTDDRTEVDPTDETIKRVFEATGVINEKCMITAISSKIGITAGHCVLYPFGTYEGVIKDVACVLEDIRWYTNGEHSRCLNVLAAELNDFADYAIVELSNAPLPLGAPEAAVFSLDYAGPVTMLGIDKQGALKRSECRILGLDAYSDRRFKHDCDTDQGSSGSLVFLPGAMKVLGLHNGAAIPKEPWNYATIYNDELHRRLLELTESKRAGL